MKALVIDDDPRIVRRLQRILKDEYIVDIAESASSGEKLAYNSHYDIILLDLMLPDMDGLDLCSILKTNTKDIPIMIISDKNSVADIDRAFDKGADDYLMKPLNVRELKARMKALLRRVAKSEDLYSKTLTLRNLMFDRSRKALFYNEKRVALRKKEMQLIEFLMVNKGRVLTRGEILEHVWDADISVFTNTVDVHMKRLRDKIEKPFNEKYIETVHGLGYIIE